MALRQVFGGGLPVCFWVFRGIWGGDVMEQRPAYGSETILFHPRNAYHWSFLISDFMLKLE